MAAVAVVFAALAAAAQALYGGASAVVELTPGTFQREVLDSRGVVVVEFYAPWCGHCKNLAPEYSKAAAQLRGVVTVAAVDADQHGGLAQQYQVQGFPTIKIFVEGKPKEYNGARTAAGIVEAALREAQALVKKRGGSSGSSGSSSSSGGKGGKGGKVLTLTDANFDALIEGSASEFIMVEFFAPWCGHCKNLEPEYRHAASQLGDRAKLVAVDATVETGLASRFGVRGYPTIVYFAQGSTSAQPYQGGRTASDIVSFIESQLVVMAPPVVELTSQAALDECTSASICVVSFLPHILDSGAEGRNKYLATLEAVAEKNKRSAIKYLWAETQQQADIEQTLNIGWTPSVVAISLRKELYATMVGAFDDGNVSSFLEELKLGKARTSRFKTLPAAAKRTPWDGKDGEMPVEETYDDEL